MTRSFSFAAGFFALCLVTPGCGSSESSSPGSTGGTTGFTSGGSVAATGAGGTASTGGSPASGATGGATASGGSSGAAPTGGRASTGGNSSSGGASGASGGSAGSSGGGAPLEACDGKVTSLAGSPFGCELAWGTNGNSGNRASFLDFITAWIGSEPEQGMTGTCYGCDLVEALAGTDVIPVYYAYIIGEAGHDANLPDCNVGGPPNLCSGGAAMIRQDRAEIIEKYAHYAQMTHDADPNKPVVWLLEGDFIQYYEPSQSSPLTLAELGELAHDITCAIKSNQPKAVVAMNHTTWNADDETAAFWGAMPIEILDLVWTTGVGDHDGFFNADTNAESYNGTSARYAFLSDLTGKKIFVDTSFGPSEQDDSWSTATESDLNGRVADGVIAVNVTDPPGSDSDYQSRIAALKPNLENTCQ